MAHHKHHSNHHAHKHHSQHLAAPKERAGSNKLDGAMIDNRMVHDNHQEGIGRKLQRHHDRNDVLGHNGKMGTIHDKAHWARKGDSLTPRKA